MKETTPTLCMEDSVTDLTSPYHYKRYKTPSCYDNIVGKPLSDKRINHYQSAGWYSAEAKFARREAAKMRAENKARKNRRSGNFEIAEDGRMIYKPL